MTVRRELDPKLIQKAARLRYSGFFKNLPAEILLEIAGRAEEVTLQKGDILFHEGDKPDGLYFVYDGRLSVEIKGRPIHRIESGAVLGEIALLDQGPRTATVKTETRTLLLKFPPQLFDEILEEFPDVAKGVIATLVEYIRRQSGLQE